MSNMHIPPLKSNIQTLDIKRHASWSNIWLWFTQNFQLKWNINLHWIHLGGQILFFFSFYVHTTRKLIYCGGPFPTGAKNAAICHLLQHFCGPPLWICSFVAYYSNGLIEHCNMYVLAALYLAIVAPHKPATIVKIYLRLFWSIAVVLWPPQ